MILQSLWEDGSVAVHGPSAANLEADHPIEYKEFLVVKTIGRVVTEKAQGADAL